MKSPSKLEVVHGMKSLLLPHVSGRHHGEPLGNGGCEKEDPCHGQSLPWASSWWRISIPGRIFMVNRVTVFDCHKWFTWTDSLVYCLVTITEHFLNILAIVCNAVMGYPDRIIWNVIRQNYDQWLTCRHTMDMAAHTIPLDHPAHSMFSLTTMTL